MSHVGDEENDAHARAGKGRWTAGENLIGKLGSIHTVKEASMAHKADT